MWKGLVKCWFMCWASVLLRKISYDGDTSRRRNLTRYLGVREALEILPGSLLSSSRAGEVGCYKWGAVRSQLAPSPRGHFHLIPPLKFGACGCVEQCCNGRAVTGCLCGQVTKPAVCAKVLLLAKPVISVWVLFSSLPLQELVHI